MVEVKNLIDRSKGKPTQTNVRNGLEVQRKQSSGKRAGKQAKSQAQTEASSKFKARLPGVDTVT